MGSRIVSREKSELAEIAPLGLSGLKTRSNTDSKFSDLLLKNHRAHVTAEEQVSVERDLGQGALRGKVTRAGFRHLLKAKQAETGLALRSKREGRLDG